MQKLSKRLQAAADFVSEGNRAADIGTDHGFLPIYLIQSGKCPQAVAMDIRKGPLERAREHIAAEGLGAFIETRLSDGMQALKAGEADSAIMTGMGGLTVIHILEEARGILPHFKELVLEPQSDPAKVRRYLREHKMEIDREELVQEAGKFYPVLHVSITSPKNKKTRAEPHRKQKVPENGQQRMYEILLNQLGNRERVQALLDQYGGCVVYGKHPLLRQMLERDEKRELMILQSLANGMQATDGKFTNGMQATGGKFANGMQATDGKFANGMQATDGKFTNGMQVADGKQERVEAAHQNRQGRTEAVQKRRQDVERRLEEIRVLLKLLG